MDFFDSKNKYFGKYGGCYVPEMLIPALEELENIFKKLLCNEKFLKRLKHFQKQYIGRPSVLYEAHNLARVLREEYGGSKNVRIHLKLESLNNTGAHKINNTVGQILLAQEMGKKHIVAETGAGQHGLATAAVCAKFNLKCTVFMGEVDVRRQYPNVFSMRQMGAEVVPVREGTCTLKDAVNAALKYWTEHIDDTHYIIGSALGPYPYPEIVQFFQSIIGEEVRTQISNVEGKLPDCIIACVGGGSNALGIFSSFIDDRDVRLVGVEAGGKGIHTGSHASRFSNNLATVGIAQGYKSYFIQDKDGQIANTYSISAGLDYAGISPQMAYLHDIKRVDFLTATDEEALLGYQLLAHTEGMIPALESSHALGILTQMMPEFKEDSIIVVNISGRGDKDLFIVAPEIEKEHWKNFLTAELEKLR